jgi:DNA-binding response OmpR family regulator
LAVAESPSIKLSKILIVEDDFMIAMALRKLVITGGYEVLGPAPTVSAALSILKANHPDACVLDITLRDGQSQPVALALREMHVPFLLSSAHKDEAIQQDAAFAGVRNLGKPVVDLQFMQALSSLLGQDGPVMTMP